MRYKVTISKNYKMIGKHNEIKSYYFVVRDTKTKKIVSKDFFYRSFAEDFASDLNIKERFN